MISAPTESRPGGLSDTLEPAQRLQQLQRLAMMGTLAAGIGHDLRNLIMPMLLRLDALEASTELTNHVRGEVQSLRKIVARLQRLAGGLRLLSSDPFEHGVEAQITNLTEWWRDIHPLIVDALPRRAILSTDIPQDLPSVAITPDALAQVVVNVVMNASRAMEDTLTPRLDVIAKLDADMVRLEITDTGRGMDAETRLRCFEPYFSTGSREFTTGLGLSVGRSLMKRFGGDLTLDATRGVGATFVLQIPLESGAGRSNVTRRRRVRFRLSDPRVKALLRLIVDNRGLEEAAADDKSPVDFIVCDAASLSKVIRESNAGRSEAGLSYSPSQIVVIGPGQPDIIPPGIVSVDASNIAHLNEVFEK